MSGGCGDGSSGDWRTPKVSHVRPTVVRPHRVVGGGAFAGGPSHGAAALVSPSPGLPAQQSTPFAPLEEGPLSPSPYVGSMEGRVRSIEQNVQQIAAMLKYQGLDGRHLQVTAEGETTQLREEIERLKRDNEELLSTLRDSEDRLSRLQEGVADMQEEYRAESQELLDRVTRLADAVEEERARRAESDRKRERAEKGMKGLEQYLTTLPSQDEFDGLKRRIRLKEEECDGLHAKLADSEALRESAVADRDGLQESSEATQQEVAALRSRLESALEGLNKMQERRKVVEKMTAGGEEMASRHLEEMLEERDRYRVESERLAKHLKLVEAKAKRDAARWSSAIAKLQKECKESSAEVSVLGESLKKERSTAGFLRADLTKARGEAAALRARVVALETAVAEAKSQEEDVQAAEKAEALLTREAGRCVRDLLSLSKAARLITRGCDPPVAQLLGTTDSADIVREALAGGGTHSSSSSSPLADRLSRCNLMLDEVRAAQADVAAMREELADKYADSLGGNFNSCVTQ